ncbi:MAG: PASTA domain-containing protein, partial [Thermoanaerobaculia bacterium]|nr:PASTA domain-containing protein [Thermoanaerobaculia bacterium]
TPNLAGRTMSNARALASDIGIVIEEAPNQERHSETVPPERVVWQSRSPGTAIKHGSTLLVARSLGPLVTEVPDISGESPRAAMLEFSQRGFGFGSLSQMALGGTRSVVTSSPPAGTVVSGQTPVSLLVSSGESPRKYVMPDLIDRGVEEVTRELEERGFQVDNVRHESYPGIPEGVIIRQYPMPGAPLTHDDVITLTVSRGDEDVVFETRPSLRLGEENR